MVGTNDLEVALLFRNLIHLFRRDDGQGLVEYVLIISLVSIVLLVALQALRTGISGLLLSVVAFL